MKVLGVIPARFNSTRFPGKPLANILGKPMLAWVYEALKKVEMIDESYVALDDERVAKVCEKLHIPYIMTSKGNQTHIDRICEISSKIEADYYTVVCGDEPLIEAEIISQVIPETACKDKAIIQILKRKFDSPSEVIDCDNIKISTNSKGKCLYLSRSPIPFPFKTVMFDYYKIIGVECYNKLALDVYSSTLPNMLEKIEDITLIRFLENGVDMYFKEVFTKALSVDTPKDLEKVIKLMRERLKNE